MRIKPLRDYEGYVILVAPLLNSVSGIAIDLFAPSMPAIARELHVSGGVMQSTISVTLVAYAVGQLVFAALLPGLVLFIVGSVVAMLAQDITIFLIGRAMQGFSVGACQVSARALLVDNVKGERFFVAVVYLSLAWGLGPVIAPFVGGLVQQYAGWRWNFALYAFYSVALLAMSLRLRESLAQDRRKSLSQSLRGYRLILGNTRFLAATLALGASLSLFLIWNIIGPFIVQQVLHLSAAFFGATALAAGISYLVGTLLSRALIRKMPPRNVMLSGLVASACGLAVVISTPSDVNLVTLILGVILSNFGQGLLFSNVVAFTMKLYADRAGATASLLGCGMMIVASLSSAGTGQIAISSNLVVGFLFAILIVLQTLGVLHVLRPVTSLEVKHESR
jgi:MFS family permease